MSMADRDRRDKERGRLRRRRSKERMREQRASEMGGEGWLDELLAVEGEAAEYKEGYALVLDELNQQKSAMAAARAQCQSLQEQIDALEKAKSLKSADGKLSLLEHACAATGRTLNP